MVALCVCPCTYITYFPKRSRCQGIYATLTSAFFVPGDEALPEKNKFGKIEFSSLFFQGRAKLAAPPIFYACGLFGSDGFFYAGFLCRGRGVTWERKGAPPP